MPSLSMAAEGFDDPTTRPLFDFFNNLLDKNASLIIIGDSMMFQLASALTCEMERGIVLAKRENNYDLCVVDCC